MSEEEIDRRIVEILKPFSFILDIGCGDGRLINALVGQRHHRVVGLDISNHGFVEAKMTTSQTAHHNLVECVECDACQVAFRDDHFEVVILTFSLHHIEETQTTLKDIHRILVPGGLVLIGEWLVKDEDQPRDGCYRFTLEELELMLQETGFIWVGVEQIEPDLVLVKGQALGQI